MRKKIFTAFILTALMLILGAHESAASYKTKLRLVIEKSAPEIPGKVSEDLIDDDGMYSGTVASHDTYTDAQGRSVTETVTVFTDRTGKLMLSADVAITANSTDFAVNAGEKFAQTVKVDAELEIADTDYSMYIFSMDIAGLPEWLKAEGELTYSADFDPEERFIKTRKKTPDSVA